MHRGVSVEAKNVPERWGYAAHDHLPSLFSVYSLLAPCASVIMHFFELLHRLCCQVQSSFAFIIPGICTAFFPSFLLPQTFIKSWSFSVTLQIFSDPSMVSVPLWSALTRTRIYSHLSKFTFMLLLWCSHFSGPDDKLIPLEKYTQNRQFSPFDLSCIRILFFQSFKNTL